MLEMVANHLAVAGDVGGWGRRGWGRYFLDAAVYSITQDIDWSSGWMVSLNARILANSCVSAV